MSQDFDLTNHFLVAMPGMVDPIFNKTLTLVCEHNDQGAFGLVVNRPIDMTIKTLLDQVSLNHPQHLSHDQPIYFGGPVQVERGFVLHRPVGDWQSTLQINDDIGLTTSRDILQAIADGHPMDLLITLGYSGWSAGQLEQEMKDNAWLTMPANGDVIFGHIPQERFDAAIATLGINALHLSSDAGHA